MKQCSPKYPIHYLFLYILSCPNCLNCPDLFCFFYSIWVPLAMIEIWKLTCLLILIWMSKKSSSPWTALLCFFIWTLYVKFSKGGSELMIALYPCFENPFDLVSSEYPWGLFFRSKVSSFNMSLFCPNPCLAVWTLHFFLFLQRIFCYLSVKSIW